jgi:multidrug resistance efflux pump
MATITLQDIYSRLLKLHHEVLDLNERMIRMNETVDSLQAKLAALDAKLDEAKADAARHKALSDTIVGGVQDLKQAVVDLKAQLASGQVTPQAALDSLGASIDAMLTKADEANAARDAADTTLQGGVDSLGT